MAEKNGNGNEEKPNNKIVGFNIPQSLDEMIDAVIMADRVESKSEFARRAIQNYIDGLPESTRKAAERIVKERYKNLKALEEAK